MTILKKEKVKQEPVMISKINFEKIKSIRKELHKIAELSGDEIKTSQKIKHYLEEFNPDKIIENIGGYGIAAVFGSSNKTKIMLRAELDALPIQEVNEFNYKSIHPNVSHKCGHDGHMSILLACADYFSSQKVDKQIILLFQPSEENGKGAERVSADPKFEEIKPDFILSFHNLPGYQKNLILLKENTFAAASVGMIIKLQGVSTHAAHPENGISPVNAVTKILQQILKLNDSNEFEDFALATPIHTNIGERAFGTAPHKAEILITLRAFKDSDMEKLKKKSLKIVEENAVSEKLNYSIEWDDEFQSTINDPLLIDKLQEVCNENALEYQRLLDPFRWSEDFGVFTHQIKGAMFGIGSGENSPQLHNPDYDFPDDIVPAAVKTILALIQKLN